MRFAATLILGVTIMSQSQTAVAAPWTTTVKYEKVDPKTGKTDFIRESVDAYQVPSGRWTVRHRDIKVTMHAGDRIILQDGTVLVIEKFQGTSERLLFTKPLPVTGKPPKK